MAGSAGRGPVAASHPGCILSAVSRPFEGGSKAPEGNRVVELEALVGKSRRQY